MVTSGRKNRPIMVTVNPPAWQRALYMVLFAIISYILLWFVFFLAFVQFLLTTINDSENDNLRQFTTRINTYFGEILDFLTYGRDEVPFPFSPLGRSKDP